MSGTRRGSGDTCRFPAVAIVASLGGLQAVTEVLRGLPGDFPAAVVLVQHGRRSPDHPGRLADLLDRRVPLPVRPATTGASVYDPGVLVVPPGSVATVEAGGRFAVDDLPAASGPSVSPVITSPQPFLRGGPGDALLTSLAAAVQPVIGVVLTGMGADGAIGVRAVKRHGGRALAQDPLTATAAGMPTSAIATGCVDFVLPLHRIAPALVALTMAPGGAELLSVPPAPWARLPA